MFRSLRSCLIALTSLWLAAATPAIAAPPGGTGVTGGAPILSGGLAPNGAPHHVPAPPSRRDHGRWLSAVTITEYWPAPESWFVGRMVTAPGLPGLHHIDWLYSAAGLSMQGEGIGLDGRLYHIDRLGSGGWVTAAGRGTDPADGWSAGAPFWRAGGYWTNRRRGRHLPARRRRLVGRTWTRLPAPAGRELCGRGVPAAALL